MWSEHGPHRELRVVLVARERPQLRAIRVQEIDERPVEHRLDALGIAFR